MRAVTSSACLSDEDLATPMRANDPRLGHLESCDACRVIWLHANDSDAPAWTVGRYQVRGTLGAGGLGVVLLGWDPVLQREVAIKFPAAQGTTLLREAQALAAIRHRNVVAVHDFGEVDGDVYFAMERVEGAPFDTWWLGATTAQRLHAVIDVAEGLGAIHAAGLVHCDIKPSNIVVTPRGDVVIVDLGLATPTGVAAGSGGTPGYRAPELERGGAPTPASDEYAFWCVVRHCFTTAKLVDRRKLDAMIARGTSVEPAQRFGSMRACSAALRGLLAPRRTMLVGGAIVGAAAIAVTTAFFVRGSDSTACDATLPAWSRDAVTKQLAPDVLARVTSFVDDERRTGEALLARACKSDDVAALRTRWCVRSSWAWIDGHLRAIANGRDVPHSLDELPQGTPAARCAPGGVTANPPAVEANATADSRKLLVELFALEGLPPAETLRALDALGDAVIATNNAGLAAAWHLAAAEALQRAGKQGEALVRAEQAMNVASRNGDDHVYARARLTVYVLRDAADRDSSTRDEEVEAIVMRAGSPGLLANFHNAAGQRAMAKGDVDNARALFARSIAALEQLELAPSMMRGSGEQNLGVALQFSRKLDDAQLHFDRAVEIFTARFGATHDETSGARLASAANLIYRGKIAEGADKLDTLAAELASTKRAETALGARVAMARCQAAQALRHEPLARCKEALAANRAVFGNDHVALVPPLLATAQLTMAKSVRDAVPLLEEALAIAEKRAGNPTDLPYARGLYALALKVVGRAADGEAVAKLAIADLDRLGQVELVATLRTHYPSLR